ncbi:MAG: 2OG-Fe(II) oxygenase family protein, partial [Pseudomonadota bacterium]|nr:2OG-Fe(II) oxygenase family protein [Pseudomonadota bacterium]
AQLSALGYRLRSLHTSHSYPIGQSVRGGTQTDGPLFARADREIRALRASIVDAVERHIRSLGAIDRRHPVLRHRPHPVRFAGSWSVRLRGAGHHTNHIHPQGWLSSAFYVSVASQELMGPAPAGWLALGEPPAELGLDLPPLRMIEPKPSRLLLFPSIMWHGTVPFAGGERLSVAFDVAPPA